MSFLQAIILGVIQGITEFLPVSSDGHLVLADYFLHVSSEGRDALGFDVLLHAGSLLALFIGYAATWKRLALSAVRMERDAWKLILFLIIATVPGAVAGLFFEDVIAGSLRSLNAAATGFLVTAAALIIGEAIGSRRRSSADQSLSKISIVHVLLMGCAQALAILPGVSRSGLTTATGRALGLHRSLALDFSFLMAVPIIGGAVAKTLLDAWMGEIAFPSASIALTGLAVSFIVSLGAIGFLRFFVGRYSLAWFAWYLLPLAGLLFLESMGAREVLDAGHLSQYVARYGSIAVFGFALAEVVPPLSFVSPGVFALAIAGALMKTPTTAVLFFAAAFAGSVLGNMVLFLLGERYGRSVAHKLHLTEQRLAVAERFMKRYGIISVFCGQFVSMVRPAIGFVAGTLHMPRSVFYTSMLLSSAAWSAMYLAFGFVLRGNVGWAISLIGSVGALLVLGAFVVTLVASMRKAVKKRRSRAAKIKD